MAVASRTHQMLDVLADGGVVGEHDDHSKIYKL